MRTMVSTALALLVAAAPAPAAWLDSDANPVFSPPGGASAPSILQDAAAFAGGGPSAEWKMWYQRGEGSAAVLGHASSPDGASWTELTGDLGVGPGLCAPRVLFDPARFGEGPAGPLYKMWASDRTLAPFSIRLLVSEDGLSWIDRGVVIDGAAEFENVHDLAVAYQPAADGLTASPRRGRR
jgi:hypothetical protein